MQKGNVDRDGGRLPQREADVRRHAGKTAPTSQGWKLILPSQTSGGATLLRP